MWRRRARCSSTKDKMRICAESTNHENPINQSFSNIKQAGKFSISYLSTRVSWGVFRGGANLDVDALMIGCNLPHATQFHCSPWVRRLLVFTFHNFVSFGVFSWGFLAHFLHLWGEGCGEQWAGPLAALIAVYRQRCQLAMVRLAAFQWH